MNTDTSILLLIAEQHAAIVSLRNENEVMRRSLESADDEKIEKKPAGKPDKG